MGVRGDVLSYVAILWPIVHKREVEAARVNAMERYDVLVGKSHQQWNPFPYNLRIQCEFNTRIDLRP